MFHQEISDSRGGLAFAKILLKRPYAVLKFLFVRVVRTVFRDPAVGDIPQRIVQIKQEFCVLRSNSIVEIVTNQSRSGNGFGGIHQLRRIR